MKFCLRLICALVLIWLSSCKKDSSSPNNTANLIFKFKYDSTQPRLDNVGQPAALASGHAAQSFVMNKMSAHYIELAPSPITALGSGAVLYKAPETTVGGATAIDFSKAIFAANGDVFFSIPLSQVPAGTYEWLRISLAYQNGNIQFLIDTTISGIHINQQYEGTVASFIGFNTYIQSYTIKDQSLTVNSDKLQGYWGFETNITYNTLIYPFSTSGQAPPGATTVVNPIFATSPILRGSCVVTAAFKPGPLTITGKRNRRHHCKCFFFHQQEF